MSSIEISGNPFALMTNPEMVFAIIENSDRLARLESRVCRPLDKPRHAPAMVAVKSFDAEIEAANDDSVADSE